jgi:hypothetical protein
MSTAMNNTNQSQLHLDNLPSEVIFEITKHLKPVDYVRLYSTNKAMRDTLSYKLEYNRTVITYLKEKFRMLAEEYMCGKYSISVFDFDYFAEDNNVCYDGKTPSFKVLYERYARWNIYKDFKFRFSTYLACLSA